MNQISRLKILRETFETRGSCIGFSDSDIFFTKGCEEVQAAQLICSICPTRSRAACLEYALSTGMQYGVWGGILFWEGRTYHRKRPAGRPRADEALGPVEASAEELWELVGDLQRTSAIADASRRRTPVTISR